METKLIQVIGYAKYLFIPNINCICKNLINNGPPDITPINIIVYLNDSDNNFNFHFCLFFL